MDWFLYDSDLRHERVNDKMKELIPNVYKLNIYQIPTFMFQGTIPIDFQSRFKRVTYPYSTHFCESNFSGRSFKFNQTKFSISARDPSIWNKVLWSEEKHLLISLSLK